MKRLPLVLLLIAGIASAQGPNPFGNGSGSGAPAPTTPAPTTPAPTTPAPTTPAPAPTGTPVPTGSPAPTGTPVPNEQPNAPGLGAQQARQQPIDRLVMAIEQRAERGRIADAARREQRLVGKLRECRAPRAFHLRPQRHDLSSRLGPAHGVPTRRPMPNSSPKRGSPGSAI